MKKSIRPTLLALLTILTSDGFSQDSSGVRKVNSLYDFNLIALDVEIAGDYAYVAGGTSGLWVVDLTDLEGYHEPVWRSEEPMDVLDALADDTLLYVADFLFGLRIFDIGEPDEPVEISRLRIWGQPCDLYLDGSNLFVAAGDHGMRRIDVSNPRNPTETGFYNHMSSVLGVLTNGRYAYLADWNRGLRVIDMLGQRGWTQVYSIGNYAPRDFLLFNGVLIVIRHIIEFLDISNPVNPTLLTRFPAEHSMEYADAVLVDEYLYAISSWYGLQAVDLSRFPNVESLGTLEIHLPEQGLDANSECVLVACREYGLRRFRLEDPLTPERAGGFGDRGHCYDVLQDDDYLYLALCEGGLEIFDIANPLQPVIQSSTFLSDEVSIVAVQGDLAFLRMRLGGYIILNVANKQIPRMLNRNDDYGLISDILPLGDIAILASHGSREFAEGIHIIDISNPEETVELAGIPIQNCPAIYFKEGDGVVYFVASNNNFYVLDVSDPTRPTIPFALQVTEFYVHGYDIAINGDYAYASYENIGLAVIDIAEPANPRLDTLLVYRYPSFAFRLELVDSTLYMEDYGVRVFNVEEPSRPREIGHYTGVRTITGMAAKENFVFMTTLRSLLTFDCSEALSVGREDGALLPSQLSLSVSPNPFNSRSVVRFELPCRADLNLALYDFNGRLLVQLIDETKNPGQYNATLDASTISAGIYIAVLKTENEFVAQKIVIIK